MKKNILPLIFLLALSQNNISCRGRSSSRDSGGRSSSRDSGGRSSSRDSGGYSSSRGSSLGHSGGSSALHSVASYTAPTTPSVTVQPQTSGTVANQAGTVANSLANNQTGAAASNSVVNQTGVGSSSIFNTVSQLSKRAVRQSGMVSGREQVTSMHRNNFDHNNFDKGQHSLMKVIRKIRILKQNKEVYLKWFRTFKEEHVDKSSGRTSNDDAYGKFVSFGGSSQGEHFDPGLDLIQIDGTVLMDAPHNDNNATLINPLTNNQATMADLPLLKKEVQNLYQLANCCAVFCSYLVNYIWQLETIVKDLDISDREANAARGQQTSYNGHNWLRPLFYKSFEYLIETEVEKAERKRLKRLSWGRGQ